MHHIRRRKKEKKNPGEFHKKQQGCFWYCLDFCWLTRFGAHFRLVSRRKLCLMQSRPPSPQVSTKYKSIRRSRVHALAVISMLIIAPILFIYLFPNNFKSLKTQRLKVRLLPSVPPVCFHAGECTVKNTITPSLLFLAVSAPLPIKISRHGALPTGLRPPGISGQVI